MFTIQIDDIWHADVTQDEFGSYNYLVFRADKEELSGTFTPAGSVLPEDQLKIHIVQRVRIYVGAARHKPTIGDILKRIGDVNAIACDDKMLLGLIPDSHEFASVSYPREPGRLYLYDHGRPVVIVFLVPAHGPVYLLVDENRLLLK